MVSWHWSRFHKKNCQRAKKFHEAKPAGSAERKTDWVSVSGIQMLPFYFQDSCFNTDLSDIK